MKLEEKNMLEFVSQIKNSADQNSPKLISSKPFKELGLFNKDCIYVYDFDLNRIIYSHGFKELLGYDEKEIDYLFTVNNIHPEDTNIVNRIIRGVVLYCIEYPENSRDNLMTMTYRREKKNGDYINVFTQSSVYERFENGMPSKGVARLIDVSLLNNSSHVNWIFEANKLDEVAFRKEINKAYDGFFTPREIEIIKELISNSTTKLISEKLGISKHTVAAHRKNIYKKSNCHNPGELISFCKNIGLTK